MDTNRFDDLTIAVAEGESRRSLLRRLLGGSAAAVLVTAGLGSDETEAQTKKECRQKCRQKRKKKQRKRCRQRCKNRVQCKRNPQCTAPQICLNNQCTGGWSCVTTSQCPSGQTCVNGACLGGGMCKKDKHCSSGQICVNGICQGAICTAVTRTTCPPPDETGTCGPEGSHCVCLQEAGGSRIACSNVDFADCGATPTCNPGDLPCPAGWLCANNPCCPDAPRCLPPCGVNP